MSQQKSLLRARAHKLKPVVIIGNQGLTESVIAEIDRALFDHELIKIRVNAPTNIERKKITHEICEHCQAELIQAIGHIIAIYRESVDQG